MASSVALVSVITSGAVAVGVPLVTARLQRSQRRDDRRAERLDELRAVVDAASIALARAESALEELETAVEKEAAQASSEIDVARTDGAVSTARRMIRDVGEASHRIAARLGWVTEPCHLYGAALKELKAELVMLIDVRDGGPSADDLEVWAEVVQSLNEVRAQYIVQRIAFYGSVSELVGPGGQLSPSGAKHDRGKMGRRVW